VHNNKIFITHNWKADWICNYSTWIRQYVLSSIHIFIGQSKNQKQHLAGINKATGKHKCKIWFYNLKRIKFFHIKFNHIIKLTAVITCKRGSTAVLRTTCCSYGKGQILHLSKPETTLPINTRFWTIDNVGEMKRIAKFGSDGFYGGLLSMWVKCTLLLFFLLVSSIRLQTTIRNGFWCTMAQNTPIGVRICLLSIQLASAAWRQSPGLATNK